MDSAITPKVTVFMPVYNASRYLEKAIKSILAQTYRDFEFLIIDDGSTDNSVEIIASFNDKRIRLVRNEKNIGLLEVLNEGMRLSRGEYIARMDSDDISLPTRLKKQVSFLDAHKDCAVVGSWAALIDENDKPTSVAWKDRVPSEHIPIMLFFHNCFVHPSVIIRRALLPTDPFHKGFTPSEDYELWLRLAKKGTLANIYEVLVQYRVHASNISKTKLEEKNDAVKRITESALSELGLQPSEEEYTIHKKNYAYDGNDLKAFLDKREAWLLKLGGANKTTKRFDQNIFKQVLADRWLISCRSNARAGLFVWKRCFRSPLSEHIVWQRQWRDVVKFALKTILRK